MSVFQIWVEDALDHGTVIDEFDTLEEAKQCYDKWVEKGPEGYDLSIELLEEIDDGYDFIYHEFHEWLTLEAWNEANPTGRPA